MEERRQAFLDASARNPYFKYSAGVTIALLILMAVCVKQRMDHRRVLWVTAEMMTDLYNHDLYSRDVAEKAIEKYNRHIECCNRAIETSQHDIAMPGVEADHDAWRTKLERVAEERDRYLRERDAAQRNWTQIAGHWLSCRCGWTACQQNRAVMASPAHPLN